MRERWGPHAGLLHRAVAEVSKIKRSSHLYGVAHERCICRQCPLEFDLPFVLVEMDACHPDARPRGRDGPQHPQRRVESPVQPPPVTELTHRVLSLQTKNNTAAHTAALRCVGVHTAAGEVCHRNDISPRNKARARGGSGNTTAVWFMRTSGYLGQCRASPTAVVTRQTRVPLTLFFVQTYFVSEYLRHLLLTESGSYIVGVPQVGALTVEGPGQTRCVIAVCS